MGGEGRAPRRPAGEIGSVLAAAAEKPESLEPAASGWLIKSSLPSRTHLTIVLFVVSGTKLSSTNDETLINSFLKTKR